MSTAVESSAAAPDGLATFRKITSTKPALTWDERLELIRRVFPSVDMDFQKSFERDIELAGRILRDVLKADQAPMGRPGPRPTIDSARAEPTLDAWMGKDPAGRPYSILPFREAFAVITGGDSLNKISNKCGIARTQVARLVRGELVPNGRMMEQIAHAYHKRPSYFLEYRIGAIAAAVMQKLIGRPDKSIGAYEAIVADELGGGT